MTILEAYDELVDALADADVRVLDSPHEAETPAVYVFTDEASLTDGRRGQVPFPFRITLLAGAWDAASSARLLAQLQSAVLAAVYALDGWLMIGAGRPTITSIGGGLYLSSDVRLSRMITYS